MRHFTRCGRLILQKVEGITCVRQDKYISYMKYCCGLTVNINIQPETFILTGVVALGGGGRANSPGGRGIPWAVPRLCMYYRISANLCCSASRSAAILASNSSHRLFSSSSWAYNISTQLLQYCKDKVCKNQ